MTQTDFICLAPLIILASAPVIIMLSILLRRNYQVIYGFTLLTLAMAFASLFSMGSLLPHPVSPLFVVDNYALLFLGILYIAGFIITIISDFYLRHHSSEREEYFIILLIALFGASVLVISVHFVTLFLGIETLGVSLYILIGYIKNRPYCIEAAVKYLIMASVASAFLLFGMALIYSMTGTMEFAKLGSAISGSAGFQPLILTGMIMIVTGIGFKLALVPFHMWSPDIYQGAPAPVSTFIATISKGSVLAVALRFFITTGAFSNSAIYTTISLIAVFSMFAGNLLALRQDNFKRLLAYSSIAQLGYLMIPLLIGSPGGTAAAIFYAGAYIVTTLGAFGSISVLSHCSSDLEKLSDYKGLYRKHPVIALVLSVSLFSLAGIPLTAGFMAKFFLVVEGVRSSLWLLIVSLIINSVIGLYYYLRVITMMFTNPDPTPLPRVPAVARIVLAFVALMILFLGIVPASIIAYLNNFSWIN